jgi:apolipoprotein N-acyltransferase
VVDVLGRVRELRSGDKNTDFHGFLLTQVYVPPQPLPAPYAKMGDWILAIPGMVALILVAGFAMLKKEN